MAKPTHLGEEHLDYLSSVLGVRSFIRPVAPPAPVSLAPTRAFKLVALFPLSAADFPLRGEMAELVAKMIRAMKLEKADVLSVEWVWSPAGEIPIAISNAVADSARARRPVIVFGYDSGFLGSQASRGEWWNVGETRVLGTYSAGDLLSSPAKKKEAWAHLQTVMREL